MLDLTRDAQGVLIGNAFVVVPGRSSTAHAGWLNAQPKAFAAGIEQAAADPIREYDNTIREKLPDAVAALDAFHVVRLGARVLD